MRSFLLSILFLVTTSLASAQSAGSIVSFDGIGALRLGMGKADLEKLLRIKIVLKHIGIDERYVETVKAKYLGKDVTLHLFGSEEKVTMLEAIEVTDPIFKLSGGIGIGTNQATIIDRYEKQLLIIKPEYADDYTIKKTSTITFADIDNYRSAIIFTILDKKVIAITVGPTPDFRDRE